MDSHRFGDRALVVTGGASGIGRATAARLASEGARVAIWDIQLEAAQSVADSLGGRHYHCDVSDPVSVERAARVTREELGQVSGLVNAAGILAIEGGVEEASVEDWDRVLNTNLRSVFMTAKFLVPVMRAAQGSAIVNIASIYGLRGYPDECAYDASKGGVVNLTRQMALQLAPAIRVNAVAPGPIETPMMRAELRSGETLDEIRSRWSDLVPIRRLGDPHEVASVIAFLLSDDSSYVSGAIVPVDGGMLAA
jgi:NAD(P)-dependent dehydrogenase (short-subunit alcohol dehydrogenase family)